MDTSLVESRDLLRQAIDDEINSLQESNRVLRSRRNTLAPISRLSPETLVEIFSLLSPSANKEACHFEWICVSHVCRRWRETALNHPRFWSHDDLTRLPPEILGRAKTEPLYLEADVTKWSGTHFDAFERQLKAHVSHTSHLSISGPLQTVLERLVSSAPTLEFLSLSHKAQVSALPQAVIPVNLFNCTTPSLTTLELKRCDIGWKSPRFKSLQTLKIIKPSKDARPKIEVWLDALSEMPQLKTIILESATPLAPQAARLIPEPSRTVTLLSLTRFHISALAKDCALALAHLVLPALTWLHVDAESHEWEGEDVQ